MQPSHFSGLAVSFSTIELVLNGLMLSSFDHRTVTTLLERELIHSRLIAN
jgi:hypothetical protein